MSLPSSDDFDFDGFDFDGFDALTFDCYGTLVDWERGIVDALHPILTRHGAGGGADEDLLARFARLEPEAQAGPWRPYREILGAVLDGFGRELGFRPGPEEREAFAASVGEWPPFPDTPDALRELGRRFRLAIVSNVDDDLFARTAERLGVDFDAVVTAEQVRSYKPAVAHFVEALKRLGLDRRRLLHVAQSLYHDVAPARSLGIRCVHVRRRSGSAGGGATPSASVRPDLAVDDLAGLVRLVGAGG